MSEIVKAKDGFHEIEEIAKDTYRIDEGGIANCYLLIGEEKALLIDSGVGVGNLEETIKELTLKPVILAVTHRHCDHDGGRSHFKEYYAHEADKPLIYGILSSTFASKTLLKGRKIEGLKLNKGRYHSKAIYFKDGATFDLGGRVITTVHTPGHTMGSVVFLDDQSKLMFTGDDVNPWLWMQLSGCSTASEWIPGAKEILKLRIRIPLIAVTPRVY